MRRFKWVVLATLLTAGISPVAFAQGAWSVRNPLPVMKSLQALTWTGSELVAVGDSGTVAISATGSAWAAKYVGSGNGLNAVTWNGSLLVAVGANGTILISSDHGATWTPKASGTPNALLSVVSTPSQFVAVGAGGVITTSPDGSIWTAQAAPSTPGTALYGIAWNGSLNLLVAVGEAGTIFTSPTGAPGSWTARTSGANNQILYSVAFVGGKFIAIGAAGTIRLSGNGTDWVPPTSVPSGVSYLSAIAAQGSTLLTIVGNAGGILTSADNGSNWTSRTANSATTQPLRGVAYTGSRWVAVGVNGTVRVSGDGAGATWADPSVTTSDMNSVAWNGSNQLVAVGFTGTVVTSADGASWTLRNSGVTKNLFSVAWGSNKFVAVGKDGTIRNSTDGGGNWNSSSTSGADAVQFNGVTWTGNQFVAVGSGGTVRTSPDGVTWGGPAALSGGKALQAVAAASTTLMVAVGVEGTIFTSINGVDWSLRNSAGATTTLYGVAVGAGQMVAVGVGGVIRTSPVSDGGVTWTSRNLATPATLYSVVWTGSLFVAGSTAGALYVSPDGISWTALSTGTPYALYGFGLRDSVLVGVGSGGAILTSPRMGPPPAPTLNLPGADATGQPILVSLTWAPVTGAVSYQLQVSTDAGFASPLLGETLTATSKTIGPLANSTKYYWRVSAKNSVVAGPYATRNFTTADAPTQVPAKTVLSTPARFSIGIPLSTTVRWFTTARAESYHVQVSTSPTVLASGAFAATIQDDSLLTDTLRAVPSLAGNTTYYWHARAKNQLGVGEWSTTFDFTTIATKPGIVTLISPADYLTGVGLSPTLTWSQATGADTYRVQVSTTPDFASFVSNDSVGGLSRTVGPLSPNTDYFWRVFARNAAGSGDTTQPAKFRTGGSSALRSGLVLGNRGLQEVGALRFRLSAREHVSIRLFDTQGKLAAQLLNEQREAGEHSVALPAGLKGSLYLLDFRAGGTRELLKILP